MKKNSGFGKITGPFLLFLIIFIGVNNTLPLIAQTQTFVTRLERGVDLYGAGRWGEAIQELRRVQTEAANIGQRAEALYWIVLAEMGAGEYQNALRDMDTLERLVPGNPRYADIPYYRGRANYYLGHYDEALVIFSAYADGIDADIPGEGARKPAALYWIGECLYSMGQLEDADAIFLLVIEQYPQSAKFEAASYRRALMNQKKIEAELLAILKWSHEESLKTVEEYQRRERSYDQAIIAYQKRIADMLRDGRLAELEASNAEYRRLLAEAENRIAALESGAGFTAPPQTGPDPQDRVRNLRGEAQNIQNELIQPQNSREERR
ncbi:MAG: tetratricopeptide repeat protein [Spirochaetaceae bacterium]|jgi:TolA-binding protein|nr:tetratricopeptide repeat protein [Spirochaetaceae bacterium]